MGIHRFRLVERLLMRFKNNTGFYKTRLLHFGFKSFCNFGYIHFFRYRQTKSVGIIAEHWLILDVFAVYS